MTHDWAYGETDVEAAARERASAEYELVEWEVEQRQDRLGRDGAARMWCAVCGERPGQSVYGLKCRGCFDAQREEREAA